MTWLALDPEAGSKTAPLEVKACGTHDKVQIPACKGGAAGGMTD